MKKIEYEKRIKLINKIIENEFVHVQDENLEGMDDLEEYNKIIEDNDQRYLILIEALPKELQKVLIQFSDAYGEILAYEIQHYFKKGVAAGTSNLNFLRDFTGDYKFY